MASTTSSLLTLLPTYDTSTLPPQLVNLATSLYAQSRTRAANLKPDEEIARAFAVAEIACSRLRNRLDLPKPQSRPPCAPKIYRRLYQYLENALPVQSKRTIDDVDNVSPSTPKKPARREPTSARTPKSGPKSTPQKVTKVTAIRVEPSTPLTTRRKAQAAKGEKTIDDPAVEVEIRKVARLLCASFSETSENDALHVFVGTMSVLTARAESRAEQVVVFDDTDIRRMTVAVFLALCQEQSEAAVGVLVEHELFRAQDADSHVASIASELSTNDCETGWQAEEWYQNYIAQRPRDGEVSDDNELEAEDAANIGDRVLAQYGIGTMVQARTDWLSEEKRRDFARWKVPIMKRIDAALSAQQAGTTAP